VLQRFFHSQGLIIIGIVLIAIAFISIWSLPLRVENDLGSISSRLGFLDVAAANTFRRISAQRFLQQKCLSLFNGDCFTYGCTIQSCKSLSLTSWKS
jgi:hypothetical protein